MCFSLYHPLSRLEVSLPEFTCSKIKSRTKWDEHSKTRAHTLTKLENSVSEALTFFPISTYHNGIDSVMLLCWLANREEWSTFLHNRVKKIGELTDAVWSYVPTKENPSASGLEG